MKIGIIMTQYEQLLQVWLFIHAIFPALNYSQEVSSTLPNGQSPCPGEEITLTCVTRGSPIIAWTSDQYIEQGGTQLEFATFHSVGETRTSPVVANTVATLTRNEVENGVQLLESKLRIITLSSFQTFSVSCIHIGSGGVATTTHQLLIVEPASIPITAHQRIDASDECVLYLEWRPPNNTAIYDVAQYMIYVDDIIMYNTSEISENQSTLNMCSCDIYSVSIRAVNRCGLLGQKTENVYPELTNCGPETETNIPTNTSANTNNKRSNYIIHAVWWIILAVICPVGIIIIIIIAIVVKLAKIKKQRNLKVRIGPADV